MEPSPSVSRAPRTIMAILGYNGCWSLVRTPVHHARRSKLFTHFALGKSSHRVSGEAVHLPKECPRPWIGQTHGARSASSVRRCQYERGDTPLMLFIHIDCNNLIRRRLLQVQSILQQAWIDRGTTSRLVAIEGTQAGNLTVTIDRGVQQ